MELYGVIFDYVEKTWRTTAYHYDWLMYCGHSFCWIGFFFAFFCLDFCLCFHCERKNERFFCDFLFVFVVAFSSPGTVFSSAAVRMKEKAPHFSVWSRTRVSREFFPLDPSWSGLRNEWDLIRPVVAECLIRNRMHFFSPRRGRRQRRRRRRWRRRRKNTRRAKTLYTHLS